MYRDENVKGIKTDPRVVHFHQQLLRRKFNAIQAARRSVTRRQRVAAHSASQEIPLL
jgi:hypothetical protein